MKQRLTIITGIIAITIAAASCGSAGGTDTGRAYMPDMYYSRAYETYGYNTSDQYEENLKKRGIHYDALPVAGTMARGDVPMYPLPGNDSGYALSATYKTPHDTAALVGPKRKEAERLYLVNCAICHGTALDGNGPLWNNGNGPFPAAPKNLKDDYVKKLADETIYFVITYGKGQMGSYASQVHPEQRWWIIKYIREKQGTGGAASASSDSTTTGGVPGGGAAGGTGTAGASSTGAATTGGTATNTMKK